MSPGRFSWWTAESRRSEPAHAPGQRRDWIGQTRTRRRTRRAPDRTCTHSVFYLRHLQQRVGVTLDSIRTPECDRTRVSMVDRPGILANRVSTRLQGNRCR